MLCALLGCLLVGGCSAISEFNAGRYDRHNALGDAWLSDQVLEPTINVTGRYVSADWGESFFSQYGRDVRGRESVDGVDHQRMIGGLEQDAMTPPGLDFGQRGRDLCRRTFLTEMEPDPHQRRP